MGYLYPVPALSILPHLSIDVSLPMHTLETRPRSGLKNSGTGASNEELISIIISTTASDVRHVLLTHTAVRTQFQTDPPDEMILRVLCASQLGECFGCWWRAGRGR
jgi:hypothetical protein